MITEWDRDVVEWVQHLHWVPADWAFIHFSDWRVKSLVFILIGLVADLRSHRRFPLGAVLATVSYWITTPLASELKGVFDRARPPVGHPEIHPLVAVPANGSMPSGHAAGAFAAAVAVGLVHPRLRWPLVVLAGLIAFSRIWLGVHYPTDVLAGAALGTAVAVAVWLTARWLDGIISARTSSP